MSSFALPVDEAGNVVPHNHPDLTNDRNVIRRICDDHVVPDENAGGQRLSSALFKNDPRNNGHLSVDSEHCITQLGKNPAEYVTTPKWYGALIISIGTLRAVDTATEEAKCWKIGMYPMDGNDCHSAVWGKITKGQSNDLQRRSDWLVQIPDVHKLT